MDYPYSFDWYVLTSSPDTPVPQTTAPNTSVPRTPSPVVVDFKSGNTLVQGIYTTPRLWSISCIPDSTLLMEISRTPSGASIKLGNRWLSYGTQQVTCSSSGVLELLYTPDNGDDGDSHSVRFAWHPVREESSQSLLIPVVVTGVLVLILVCGAVYCVCRRRAAGRKDDISNLEWSMSELPDSWPSRAGKQSGTELGGKLLDSSTV
eukprot:TRINITY_DN22158_c0_g1_i2.p1 TRINITY_DN22158_c0_g1~~TRINITY_DN22158_c0_g1_i2.p1  ORF type:complete len:206 (+),score=20.67 TRINITY_DN22158_c0_g1_i2:1279-1896(+)